MTLLIEWKGTNSFDGLSDLIASDEDYHKHSRVSLRNEEIKLWNDDYWLSRIQGYDNDYFDRAGDYLPLFVALKRKKLNLLILDYYKLCRRVNSDNSFWGDVSSLIPNPERLRKQQRIANTYVDHAKHHQETKHLDDWMFDTTNDEFLKEIEKRYNL